MAEEERSSGSGLDAEMDKFGNEVKNEPFDMWKTHGASRADSYEKWLKEGNQSKTLKGVHKDNYAKYEAAKENSSEEGGLSYDESAVNWTEMKDPIKITVYAVYPAFLIADDDKNTYNYVKSKAKEHPLSFIGKIQKEARKKLGEDKDSQKDSNEQTDESAQNNTTEQPKQGKKSVVQFIVSVFKGNSRSASEYSANSRVSNTDDPVKPAKPSEKLSEEELQNAIEQMGEE